MTTEINNTQDTIDIRDIIERIEELESMRDNCENSEEFEEAEELESLNSLMDDLKGNGGDEKWRGDWYPLTLIRDDYFENYAEELVKDSGYISNDLPSWIEIDWKATSENVQQDYFSIEFDGETYWAK